MDEVKELSDKHKLFVAEYVKNNCNGMKAYKAVYDVDNNTAKVNACKLLTDTNIKAAVNKEIERILADKTELTLQVINEYKKIAFSDMAEYIDPITGENVIDENTETGVIESIQFDTVKKADREDKTEYREKFKFKLYNKQAALDSIAKLVIGLSEKHEIELPDFTDATKSLTDLFNKIHGQNNTNGN
jgi:phage terminase small subunit